MSKHLKHKIDSKKENRIYLNKNIDYFIHDVGDGNDKKGIISFLYLQNNHQCFSEWTKQEMDSFWEFYKKFHKYTWTLIYSTSNKNNKKGLGYTVIDKKQYPNSNFKNSLSDDVTLFEIRVTQKARVHGFRHKSVFYICWLDRNHDILK